ncbi:7TM domain-containing protein [Winogradskyella sp.]
MNKSFQITIYLLIAFAMLSMAFKLKPLTKTLSGFMPSSIYEVSYNFYIKGDDKRVFVKSYLPKSNHRQKISNVEQDYEKMTFKIKDEKENQRATWRSKTTSKFHSINYSFLFKGKAVKYNIAENLSLEKASSSYANYLVEEEHIEVHHPSIDSLARILTKNTKDLKSLVTSLYDYVNKIPSAPIRDLTSALTAFKQNQASCNGKARLFVALCRNRGIAARLKGGLILEETKKRTSHLWTEVNINGTWIPFDVLNNHFAYLPANYLELYTGDHFLITHTPSVLFDYNYEIKPGNNVPFINSANIEELSGHPISLLKVLESKIIPKSVLYFLLLLPLGGLLISLIKNVIGLKTFGIFLPILIAYTLTTTGYVSGILLFLLMTLIVVLLSFPLNKWGLLYTPKMAVVLTATIIIMLMLLSVGLHYKLQWLTTITFFPIIIISIMAERFSRAIEEDGHQKALSTLFQTLVATSICYLVFSSVVIKTTLLLFPELLLLVLAISLKLGKWIGLRLFEYQRFSKLITK